MGIEAFNVRKTNIKLYPGYDCGAVSLQNGTLLTFGNAKKGGAFNVQYMESHPDVVRNTGAAGSWRYFTGSEKILNHYKMLDYYSRNIEYLKFTDVKFNESSGAGLTRDNKLYVWGDADLGGGFYLFENRGKESKFVGDNNARNLNRFLNSPLEDIIQFDISQNFTHKKCCKIGTGAALRKDGKIILWGGDIEELSGKNSPNRNIRELAEARLRHLRNKIEEANNKFMRKILISDLIVMGIDKNNEVHWFDERTNDNVRNAKKNKRVGEDQNGNPVNNINMVKNIKEIYLSYQETNYLTNGIPFYIFGTLNFNNVFHCFSYSKTTFTDGYSEYNLVINNVKDVIIKYNLMAILYHNDDNNKNKMDVFF